MIGLYARSITEVKPRELASTGFLDDDAREGATSIHAVMIDRPRSELYALEFRNLPLFMVDGRCLAEEGRRWMIAAPGGVHIDLETSPAAAHPWSRPHSFCAVSAAVRTLRSVRALTELAVFAAPAVDAAYDYPAIATGLTRNTRPNAWHSQAPGFGNGLTAFDALRRSRTCRDSSASREYPVDDRVMNLVQNGAVSGPSASHASSNEKDNMVIGALIQAAPQMRSSS